MVLQDTKNRLLDEVYWHVLICTHLRDIPLLHSSYFKRAPSDSLKTPPPSPLVQWFTADWHSCIPLPTSCSLQIPPSLHEPPKGDSRIFLPSLARRQKLTDASAPECITALLPPSTPVGNLHFSSRVKHLKGLCTTPELPINLHDHHLVIPHLF